MFLAAAWMTLALVLFLHLSPLMKQRKFFRVLTVKLHL